METQQDLVSILICSRDRRRDLESVAKAFKGMATKYSFQIVAVEETDHPVPISGITYVPHPVANRGIPYARNLALAHATGAIIVFLDDDCRIHDGWSDKILEAFKDDSVVGVQGGVTVPETTNALGWAESILGFPGGGITRVWQAQGKVQETREVSTLNCAYRRWVLDKIGGFDEMLKLGSEDNLLAKQACDYGRCIFVPGAMVSHKARGSLAQIWKWFVRRGRAEVDLIRTGKQKDNNFWTVLKSSLAIKLAVLMITAINLSAVWAAFLITLGGFIYLFLQYARYVKPWRFSKSTLTALIVLPVVKLTMDMATDWGRFRGLFFA